MLSLGNRHPALSRGSVPIVGISSQPPPSEAETKSPYRDPGDSVREWERQQGSVALKVHAGEVRNPATRRFVKVGLPFGSRPRLILAHLNREAILRRSAETEVEVENSLTAFIRRLQQSGPNGKEIRRFKEQSIRFSAALVRLAYDASSDHLAATKTSSSDYYTAPELGIRLQRRRQAPPPRD